MRLSVVRATYNDDRPGLFFKLGTGNIDSVVVEANTKLSIYDSLEQLYSIWE